MRELIGKLLAIMTPKERRAGMLVLLLMIVTALFDVVGVASIMPFLGVLANPSAIETNNVLKWVYSHFGFTSVDGFLKFLGAAAFVLITLSGLVRGLTSYTIHRFTQLQRHSIGLRLLEVYLRQPYAFFLNRHSGDLAKGVLSEVDQLVNMVILPVARMCTQALMLMAMIVFLFIIDPEVALLVALALGGAYGAIYASLRGYLNRIGTARLAANRARFQTANEALGGIKDIKLLGREHDCLERFAIPSQAMARHQAANATLSEVPKYGIEAVAFGGILLLCLFLMARDGAYDGGALGDLLPLLGLYAFAGYRTLPAIQQVYTGVTRLRFGAASINSIHDDLSQGKALPELARSDFPRVRVAEGLKLVDVSFSYPNADGVGVRNVSLDIPAGSTIGIVGSTGAGKTTLVDLILGLLTPSAGHLEVDDVRIGAENRRAWQNSLGYVPQDVFLLDASIAQNIALGIPESRIDRARVVECAWLSQLNEFIETELPDGFDTLVGERGVRLSGGQRQRIGIARAIYHDPEVIVFDEATSALDNLTERDVMEAIGALSGSKTIIMIAHRLSTVRVCDRIVVLENGQIAGVGTYDELSRDNNVFRRIAAVANAA